MYYIPGSIIGTLLVLGGILIIIGYSEYILVFLGITALIVLFIIIPLIRWHYDGFQAALSFFVSTFLVFALLAGCIFLGVYMTDILKIKEFHTFLIMIHLAIFGLYLILSLANHIDYFTDYGEFSKNYFTIFGIIVGIEFLLFCMVKLTCYIVG